MSNSKSFFAKYGDENTRVKLSTEHGEHLQSLIDSPQKLSDEIKDNIIGHGWTTRLMKKHALSPEHIQKSIDSHALASSVISNTNLPNNPHRDEIHSKLAENPEYHSRLAIMDDEHPMAAHVRSKLVDSIITHNSKAAARQLIGKKLDSQHTEKLLKHFDDDTIHSTAARYGNLTDDRVKHYVATGRKPIEQNMNLTDTQSKMVPNHIFHELGILDQLK